MIVLGQFFTSSVSIGLTMFQLTLVRVVLDFFFCTGCDFLKKVAPFTSECYSLLFYVGSATVQIFLYCWFGNEVEYKVRITRKFILCGEWSKNMDPRLNKNEIYTLVKKLNIQGESFFCIIYTIIVI
jgi:hypothetical protein